MVAPAAALAPSVALLVMGDGSARKVLGVHGAGCREKQKGGYGVFNGANLMLMAAGVK